MPPRLPKPASALFVASTLSVLPAAAQSSGSEKPAAPGTANAASAKPAGTTAAARPALEQALTGEARAEYDSALVLYEDGDFAGASLKFQRAHALSNDPNSPNPGDPGWPAKTRALSETFDARIGERMPPADRSRAADVDKFLATDGSQTLTMLLNAVMSKATNQLEGAINLVIGRPESITPVIMQDRRVVKISFTGSVPIGRQIVEQSARTLKRVTMELGGHAPVIVHSDADIDSFATAAALGKFRNAGQVCASPTRFFIHESIFDQVARRFAERTATLRLGDPLDAKTDLGPLTTARRRDAIERLVDEAASEGAKIVAGGKRPQALARGWYYEPTLVANPKPHVGLMNEEPFGPVGTLTPFATLDEVIAEANRLPFALAAYVYTRSLRKTHETTERLHAGVIGVNTFVASTAETPFGGSKESGFGREGGPTAIRDYLHTKFLNIAMPSEALE